MIKFTSFSAGPSDSAILRASSGVLRFIVIPFSTLVFNRLKVKIVDGAAAGNEVGRAVHSAPQTKETRRAARWDSAPYHPKIVNRQFEIEN
jgi:hypothetical protein